MSAELNQQFIYDPLAFMKKYSVSPPDLVGNAELGRKMQDMPNTTGTDYVFSGMSPTKRVAYLNFEKRARGTAPNMAGLKGSASITVDGSYLVRPNTIKSYFLPWNAAGGIVKLTIPAMGPNVPDNDVRYFFTASVNGCSIFIKGTPQSPQIFHAGGSTGHGNNPVAAAQFWRDLMTRYTGTDAIAAEVNKMDYISSPNTASGFTPHIETFKGWLEGSSPTGLHIERVEPWGCVMGLRDLAGNWGFYLQENADVVHTTFTKKHFFSLKRTVKGATISSARPMLFRKFFPGGLAHVNFVPTMPRKL